MELLTALVVGEIRLLDNQLLEDGVGLLLGGDGPWDAFNDLEWEVGDYHLVLVLLGRHSVNLKRCLQLPEPEFRILKVNSGTGKFRLGAWDTALTSMVGLSSGTEGN